MKDIVKFLVEVGELKKMPRQGWILRGIKNPECIASHVFRAALMAWVVAEKKKINISRVIKMTLIHDICEVYAGDTTPYHNILPADDKKWKKITEKWPRLSKKEKEKFYSEKHKKEEKSLKKIILGLSPFLKKEIMSLWSDYENGLTAEGRFVRQIDRLENLLQALEYQKDGKKFAMGPWWVQVEELVDDPVLLDLMREMEKFFLDK